MEIKTLRLGLRLILLTVVLVVAWRVLPVHAQSEATAKFSLVLVSETYVMDENGQGRGGVARIAAALKRERQRNEHVFVAHSGDAIFPSLMSGLDRGAHMIDLLNMLELDMFVPGNHEFDFGPEVFMDRMAEARFPIYAANLKGPDGATLPAVRSHSIVDVGGVRIGIGGLTTDDASVRSSPGNLSFDDVVNTAGRLTAALRKAGADVVVLVAHAERATDEVLRARSGADVILSGDDPDLLIGYDGRTAFAETMRDGTYIVAIDLDISVAVAEDGTRRVRWWPDFRLIDTAGIEPDEEVAAQVALYQATLTKDLGEPIATTSTQLDSRTATVRGGEAAIGNLVTDAMRAETGADVALINGGGLRGNRIYPPGSEMTRRHILAELPFANKAVVLEIAGSDLKQALEQGLAEAERLSAAFPQVSGIEVEADLSRPPGERVVAIGVDGEALDEDAQYKLVTSDFLARGGDGYSALEEATVLVGPDDAELIADHAIAYISDQREVSPTPAGRIELVRPSPGN